MQSKISAFFKPAKTCNPIESEVLSENSSRVNVSVTYTRRRNPNSQEFETDCDGDAIESREVEVGSERLNSSTGKVVSKKRRYGQYHLELGQSDFLLHTCSVCGMMYACGDEGDEKTHTAFHRDYYEGFQFKGWSKERVVSLITDKERILLVLDGDPAAHKHKVQELVKVVERELGSSTGQIFHNLYKVYLFISRQRTIGCLIAEPIRRAHKVIPRSYEDADKKCNMKIDSKVIPSDLPKSNSNSIQFGNVHFQREIIKKKCASVDQWDNGAILCEEASVPTVCGIKAVWVVPSRRRQRVASQLLDAVRLSFLDDCKLEKNMLAFSAPTSAGKSFASRYCGSNTFLVYTHDDV